MSYVNVQSWEGAGLSPTRAVHGDTHPKTGWLKTSSIQIDLGVPHLSWHFDETYLKNNIPQNLTHESIWFNIPSTTFNFNNLQYCGQKNRRSIHDVAELPLLMNSNAFCIFSWWKLCLNVTGFGICNFNFLPKKSNSSLVERPSAK